MRALRLLAIGIGLCALSACDSPGDTPDPGVFAEAEANPGQWTFIDVEGAQCRDGSATGFGIRLQEGADDLLIYLEGGGACFNSTTCGSNPSSFSRSDFTAGVALRGNAGIFSTASSNPVGDWNMVYVPYCTGDVHGGNAPDASVPGVSATQQFVGHQNIERYLDVLGPYLGDPSRLLLTGASAGGFGTLVNLDQVADTFDRSELTLLNDSGPIFFADNVFSPDLASSFVQLYSFDDAFSGSASALFETDGLEGIYDYYDARYPDATFGIASTLEDQVIRFFFGFGQNDGTITGPEYAEGLRDLRANLPSSWGTYFASGGGHTFISANGTYLGSSAGVSLNEWVGDLIDGNPSNVDPEIATVASRR